MSILANKHLKVTRCTALAILAGHFLSGCDQVSEIEAMTACFERLEATFPEAKGLTDEATGDVDGLGETGSDGNFSFTVLYNDGAPAWTCRGNNADRRIDELSFKGVAKQPAADEYWSY